MIRAFPTFVFFIKKERIAEVKGADAAGLEAAIMANAPKAAPSSSAFSGSGVALGSGIPHNTADVRAARLSRLDAGASTATRPVAAASTVTTAPAAPSGTMASSALFVQLTEMGFDIPRVTRALRLTRNSTVEAAIEWLEANEGDAGDSPTDSPQTCADTMTSALPSQGEKGEGTGLNGLLTAEDDDAIKAAELAMQPESGPKRKMTAEEVSALLSRRRAEKVNTTFRVHFWILCTCTLSPMCTSG